MCSPSSPWLLAASLYSCGHALNVHSPKACLGRPVVRRPTNRSILPGRPLRGRRRAGYNVLCRRGSVVAGPQLSLHPLGAPNVGSSFVHWAVGGRLRRRASVWSSSPGLALVRPLSGAHYLLHRCRLGVRNRLSHRSFVRIISGERRGCAHRGSRGVSYGHPAGIGGLRCRATLAQPAPESTRRAGI